MRKTGILLPIFSLPSDYGIGDFGKGAYLFADFLKESGQSFWQILPLCPTTVGDSPYQSPSAYGGNPYFISIDMLKEEGLLKDDEICCIENHKKVDYSHLYNTRYKILKTAFQRFKKDKDYEDFYEKNKFWLYDHSLFFAIKKHFNNLPFNLWNDGIKRRVSHDMKHFSEEFSEDVEFHNFLQFKFYQQWYALKSYVNGKGIKIIGDMPIYVSYDSSDVWKNPDLFCLDDDLVPKNIAGCPPDGFSEDGQLWGNPLYDWKAHEAENFRWWKSRIDYNLSLFDIVRIDHFRGFDSFYAIPYGEETAKFGEWEKGPGIKLFESLNVEKEKIIAEDLGFITPSVKKLLEDTDYSGIKVLQFGFDERDDGDGSEHLPHNYSKNCIAYTGTHDNQTLSGWISSVSKKEIENVREYLCDEFTPREKLTMPLISEVLKSNARITIIPVQDYMELSDEARINTPGNAVGNWNFRLRLDELSDELSEKIKKMTQIYGRI